MLTVGALLAQPAMAEPVERSLCVFDVVGRNGDTYQLMRDYVLAAKEWGVEFTMKPYTDEALVVADFRAGKCDAVRIEPRSLPRCGSVVRLLPDPVTSALSMPSASRAHGARCSYR